MQKFLELLSQHERQLNYVASAAVYRYSRVAARLEFRDLYGRLAVRDSV